MVKIIFCEDDPVVQKVIRIALRSTPHEIHIVGNGAEGLILIERELPDAVFTDVSMPVLDGLQLIDELRLRPHLAHIPVVIVTASVQRYQVEDAYRRGIAGYLSKPFSVHDLRNKVELLAGTTS